MIVMDNFSKTKEHYDEQMELATVITKSDYHYNPHKKIK